MEYIVSGGNRGANIYIDNHREDYGIVLFDVNMMDFPQSFHFVDYEMISEVKMDTLLTKASFRCKLKSI